VLSAGPPAKSSLLYIESQGGPREDQIRCQKNQSSGHILSKILTRNSTLHSADITFLTAHFDFTTVKIVINCALKHALPCMVAAHLLRRVSFRARFNGRRIG